MKLFSKILLFILATYPLHGVEPQAKKAKTAGGAQAAEAEVNIDLRSWQPIATPFSFQQRSSEAYELQSFASPKHSKKELFIKNLGRVNSILAGQDYLMQEPLSAAHPEEVFLAIFDGHSKNGELFSTFCGEFLKNKFSTNRDIFALHLERDEKAKIIQEITSWFKEAHQKAVAKYGPRGGTTATLVCLFIVNQKKFIISANVGDSKALIKNLSHADSEIEALSEDHSPENPAEFLRYQTRCEHFQVPIEKKALFVYPQFNLQTPEGPIRTAADLPIFESTGESECKLDEASWEYFYEEIAQHYPLGTQARRDKPATKEACMGCQIGWGSRVAPNSLQMARSLGDAEDKLNYFLDEEPTVFIKELDPASTYQLNLGSDGFWDAHLERELFEADSHEKQLQAFIFDKTYPLAESIFGALEEGYPAWDDLTVHHLIIKGLEEASGAQAAGAAAKS